MLVALAMVVAVGAGLVFLHQRGSLNQFLCEGPCSDEYVSAPDELDAPGTLDPLVSAASSEPADRSAVEAAIAAVRDQPVLGPHVGISVRTLKGTEIVGYQSDGHIPASTTKVLTGFAALVALDPEQRFETTTVLDGGSVVLVGGGDPFLMATPDDKGFAARADLATLAQRTVEQLAERGLTQISLGYDDTLFTGPAEHPSWSPGYAAQNSVSPISALWTDRGQVDGQRQADPAGTAAAQFAAELAARGIAVTSVAPREAPDGASDLAIVEGPTVAQAVERVELTSDNGGAEVLGRHVARALGLEPSFAGATQAITQVLDQAGVDTAGLYLADASGLSRDNRIAPSLLTDVLARSVTEAPTLVASLPVAGFSGSLAQRFVHLAGPGLVRAKTGLLNQVHSLAGVVTTADGVVLAVSVMSDTAVLEQPLEGRAAVDAVLASLAACTCGGP